MTRKQQMAVGALIAGGLVVNAALHFGLAVPWLWGAVLGVVLSEMVLLGVWLTLRRGSLVARCANVLIVGAWLSLALGCFHAAPGEVLFLGSFFAIGVLSTASGLLLMRRCRIEDSVDGSPPAQYSLRKLLWWTTAAALFCGVLSAARPEPAPPPPPPPPSSANDPWVQIATLVQGIVYAIIALSFVMLVNLLLITPVLTYAFTDPDWERDLWAIAVGAPLYAAALTVVEVILVAIIRADWLSWLLTFLFGLQTAEFVVVTAVLALLRWTGFHFHATKALAAR